MTDQLIDFETAKIAKEKGFSVGSINYYNLRYGDLRTVGEGTSGFAHQARPSNTNNIFAIAEAPTQSLLQRWLREVHNIKVFVDYVMIGSDDYEYGYIIKHEVGTAKRQCERLKIIESIEFYCGGYSNPIHTNTYEAVLEAGLTEALKLIP